MSFITTTSVTLAWHDQVQLATPTGLTATVLGPWSVSLAWTQAGNPAPTGSGISAYLIQRAPAGGSPVWVTVATTQYNPYIDTTVSPGTAYQYRVIAQGSALGSTPSPTVTVPPQADLQPGDISPLSEPTPPNQSSPNVTITSLINDGQNLTANWTVQNVPGPAWTQSIGWSDGTGDTIAQGTLTATHAYQAPGDYQVSVAVVDQSWAPYVSTGTAVIDLFNPPPTALALRTPQSSAGTSLLWMHPYAQHVLNNDVNALSSPRIAFDTTTGITTTSSNPLQGTNSNLHAASTVANLVWSQTPTMRAPVWMRWYIRLQATGSTGTADLGYINVVSNSNLLKLTYNPATGALSLTQVLSGSTTQTIALPAAFALQPGVWTRIALGFCTADQYTAEVRIFPSPHQNDVTPYASYTATFTSPWPTGAITNVLFGTTVTTGAAYQTDAYQVSTLGWPGPFTTAPTAPLPATAPSGTVYAVYRLIQASTWQRIGTTADQYTCTYLDTTAVPATPYVPYEYYVTAYTPATQSTPSSAANATTPAVTVVTTSITLAWSDLVPASGPATLILAWQDLAAIQAGALVLAWGELSQVAPTIVLAWNDLRPVTATALVLDWRDLSAVAATRLLAWSDLVRAGAARLVLAWGDRALVVPSIPLAWNDRKSVTATALIFDWQDRVALARTLLLAWQDRLTLARSVLLSWTDRKTITSSTLLAWTDRAVVTAARTLAWQDHVPVAAPALTLAWQDRKAVARAVALTWRDYAARTAPALTLAWQDHVALTASSLTLAWKVAGHPVASLTMTWQDHAQMAGPSITLSWSIRPYLLDPDYPRLVPSYRGYGDLSPAQRVTPDALNAGVDSDGGA